MRIGVYNRHWATGGGGERYAGAFAQALVGEHDVELLGHEPIDRAGLEERARARSRGHESADRRGQGLREPRPRDRRIRPPGDVLVHERRPKRRPARDLCSPLPDGVRPRSRPCEASARAGSRPDPQTGAVELEWGRGFHLPERGRLRGYRWTAGTASLALHAPERAAIPVGLTFGPRPAAAGPAEVEVAVDGEPVTHARIDTAGAVPVRFTIVGRGRDDPVDVSISTDTFVPRERLGTPDARELGVQLRSVQVGSGAASWLEGRFPWIAATHVSLDFLDSYDEIVAISNYTSDWIRRSWGRASTLLYPPVDAPPPAEKEPIVLAVGRFFDRRLGHSKKQLELVRAFRRLVRSGAAGWELHLVGGCSPEHLSYLEEVTREASGLPVHFHVDAPGTELRDLYGRAAIFWHAAGLGESERRHPHRLEHFGITTVEAMGAGAVPVVIAKGGQPEIMEDGVSGFLFATERELVERTRRLIQDPDLRTRMSRAARERAERFSHERFTREARRLTDRVLRAV